MATKCFLINVPVQKTEGEENTTYTFEKDEHARCLLENLAEMQANKGLLTDVVVCTGSKDYEASFHSMLLAACSPVVKRRLVERASMGSKGRVVLHEMSKDLLQFFAEFIYRSEITLDKDMFNLEDLHNFAVKYGIDSLQATCEQYADSQIDSAELEIEFDDHEDVLSELFKMFLEKELTSTVLEDNKGMTEFAVHGPLIAAASPVLQEALSKCSPAGDKKRLHLDMSSVVLEDLIGYIYTAKVTLQRQNAVGLLEAACAYQMPALASVCCDWLIARLDTYDVVGLLCRVRKLDSEYTEGLEDAAKKYIVANFSELSTDEKFNSLRYEDLKEIIEDDKLDLETEEDVFYVVMRWIECDANSRLHFLCDLLACVRFEQTSAEFMDDVQHDPRIGSCPDCVQILEGARKKLNAADKVKSSPVTTVPEKDDIGDTSLVLKDCDELSSVSSPFERESLREECLRDSVHPGETPLRKDGRPDMRFKENRELYLKEGMNKSGRPDKRLRWNKGKVPGPPKNSGTPLFYDTSSRPLSEGTFLKEYDGMSSVSSPSYRRTLPQDCLRDTDQSRQSRLRKDGRPDMRCKENRLLYLEEGANKNGSPDRRLKENRVGVPGPLKKNGTPDMRYKVNKEVYGRTGRKLEPVGHTACDSWVAGPVKKNGALESELPSTSCYFVGPLKKDGSPDMRYTVNKQLYGACSMTSSVPRGPLKKNGTPDMRYAANKQAYRPVAQSPRACGPLKKNGTPDMRFKANR